jgi:hypothetical protein
MPGDFDDIVVRCGLHTATHARQVMAAAVAKMVNSFSSKKRSKESARHNRKVSIQPRKRSLFSSLFKNENYSQTHEEKQGETI